MWPADERQMELFFQSFTTKFGVSFEPECELDKVARKYVKERLNDGRSREYHLMKTWELINNHLLKNV